MTTQSYLAVIPKQLLWLIFMTTPSYLAIILKQLRHMENHYDDAESSSNNSKVIASYGESFQ